jgi:hypothetical protein
VGSCSVQANRKRGNDCVDACANWCGQQRAALIVHEAATPSCCLEKMRFIHTTIDEFTSNLRKAGLGQRRVAWTAMAQPMHLGRLTGAASGRRRFQYFAKAGYARVTMEAISDGALASSAAVREPSPANILRNSGPVIDPTG